MTIYTTSQGDMWDLIAWKLTGSAEQVAPIMQANPKYAKTYIFPAGIDLNIPDLNTVVNLSVLPPWRRF